MPITNQQIQTELDKGYNVFCATCVHHHDGLTKGLPSCIQSAKTCGGPLRGMEFPDYLGPIPRDRFHEVCLICGDPAPFLKVISQPNPSSPQPARHTFSLCKKHHRAIQVLPNIHFRTHDPVTVPAK